MYMSLTDSSLTNIALYTVIDDSAAEFRIIEGLNYLRNANLCPTRKISEQYETFK